MNPFIMDSHCRNTWDAKYFFQFLDVHLVPPQLGLIPHIQGQHGTAFHFTQLDRDEEPSF